MERERLSSAVCPALLHDGRHPLLVLPLVFLIELCSLAVRRAVGVWLIQQRLGIIKEEFNIIEFNKYSFCEGHL